MVYLVWTMPRPVRLKRDEPTAVCAAVGCCMSAGPGAVRLGSTGGMPGPAGARPSGGPADGPPGDRVRRRAGAAGLLPLESRGTA